MDLLEYQGKELLGAIGVPVPKGGVARSPGEAQAIAEHIGGRTVVKAQVRVGGRGKAGGIQVAASPRDARKKAEQILGMDISGHTVHSVWLEPASNIDREYYASVIFDRGSKAVLMMLSSMGGVDIEEVAETNPGAVAKVHIDPLVGYQAFHGRKLAFSAGIEQDAVRPVVQALGKLYEAFVKLDCMLVEVNPLVVTGDRELVALDSKVTVDDSAMYRQPAIQAFEDEFVDGDPQERVAREKGLTYVKLDGEVGILGNGAGLVMSTLDVVAQAGGRPANFLDVGGGAKAGQIVEALELILSDGSVKAVLFNIFGGITRCDEVARGILAALDEIEIRVPLVVRIDGTNDEEGRKLLAEGGRGRLHVESTMLGAAREAVRLAHGDTG